MRRYGHLAGERLQLDREIARLEEEKNPHRLRVAGGRAGHRPARSAGGGGRPWTTNWPRLGPQSPMPEDAVRRLDALNGRMRKRQRATGRTPPPAAGAAQRGLGAERSTKPCAGRPPASRPCRNKCRGSPRLQGQVGGLEKEIADTSAAIAAEHKRLGLDGGERPLAAALAFRPQHGAAAIGQPGDRPLPAATRPGAAGRRGRRGRGPVAGVADRSRLERPARTGSCPPPSTGPAAWSRNCAAASRSTQRLDQISGCQQDLEAQSRRLLDRQLPSIWALAGLGTIFVAGRGAGHGRPVHADLDHRLAGLGPGGARGGRQHRRRAGQDHAGTLQRRGGSMPARSRSACSSCRSSRPADDRDALDAQLPHGGGPIAARLAAAEKDLAALEELLPLETRRAALGQEAAAAGAARGRGRARVDRGAAPLARGLAPDRLAAQACSQAS